MCSIRVRDYVVSAPIYDIIERLRGSLTNGKLARVSKKGDYVSVTCPFHSDGMEKENSCGVYAGSNPDKYGRFNCFTCGSHGSFVRFVALCMDSSDATAEDWLIGNFGERSQDAVVELEEIQLGKLDAEKFLDDSVFEGMQSYHPYMDKRHLTKKVRDMFWIRYDPKSECLVFPVWDERGRLVMLTRRSVSSKRFYIDKDKEKPVYLMNFIRSLGISEVTVMESQINALTAWGWGIPSVATFGCNVTPKQMDILNRSDVRHVYVCFDGDAAGEKGTRKLIEGLRKDIFVDVISMPNGKDVNDLTEDEFNGLDILPADEWERLHEGDC